MATEAIIVPYTLVVKTTDVEHADARGGFEWQATGEYGTTAWLPLTASGFDRAATTQLETKAAYVGEISSLSIRTSSSDGWTPEWVDIYVGASPPAGQRYHIEPIPPVKLNTVTAKVSTLYKISIKVRNGADDGATGGFTLQLQNETGQLKTNWMALQQALPSGSNNVFYRYNLAVEPLGNVAIQAADKSLPDTLNLETITVEAGTGVGARTYIYDIPATFICNNTASCYFPLKYRRNVTVALHYEEHVARLQQQITSLQQTVNQLTDTKARLIGAAGTARYQITAKTGIDSWKATTGSVDVQIVGVSGTTAWRTLKPNGFEAGSLYSFELDDLRVGEVTALNLRTASTDNWRPDQIDLAVGHYPEVETYRIVGINADVVKGTAAFTTYPVSVEYHVIFKAVSKPSNATAFNIAGPKIGGAPTDMLYIGWTNMTALQAGEERDLTLYGPPLVAVDRVGWKGPVGINATTDFQWIIVAVGPSRPGRQLMRFNVPLNRCRGLECWLTADLIVWKRPQPSLDERFNTLTGSIEELQFYVGNETQVKEVDGVTTEYTVKLTTCPDEWCGAKNDITISLVGEQGATEVRTLGPLAQNTSKTWVLRAEHVGRLTKVVLGNGKADNYRVTEAEVRVGLYPGEEVYVFINVINLATDAKDAVIPASTRYSVKITVRDHNAAGGLGPFYIRLLGTNNNNYTRTVPVSTKDLLPGAIVVTDTFGAGLDEVATFQIFTKANVKLPDIQFVEVVEFGDHENTIYKFGIDQGRCQAAVPNAKGETYCTASKDRRGDPVKTATGGSGGGVGLDADTLKEIQSTRGIMGALGRAAINMQFADEQRVAAEGASGIIKVRAHRGGSATYYDNAFTSSGVAAVHDHSDNLRTVGMGEFTAVMNGVYFQTRHNDYGLRMPANNTRKHKAVEDIPFPDVPPAVLNAGSVANQVTEMREWFKAWQSQNKTVRDYTKYFKPVMCYVEGTWLKATDSLQEPFASDRHNIEASTWEELYGKVRYLFNSGIKNNLENLPYLPSVVRDMTNNGTVPVFANFEYRILCQPLKDDVPLNRFRVVRDFHVLLGNTKPTLEQLSQTRFARFEMNPKNQAAWREGSIGREYIDELMEQIPGRDNGGAVLSDTSFNLTATNHDNPGTLNTAYYSRYYATEADAMGRAQRRRGFNDPTLWAAMTTQEDVFGMKVFDDVKNVTAEQKWTWAFPLEIIWLTPLVKWNPHNIEYKGNAGTPAANTVTAPKVPGGRRRNGDPNDPALAFDGTHSTSFYQTPAEFFGGNSTTNDAADTAKGVAGVLDKTGTLRKVTASGTHIFLPPIPGVGVVRIRYPIMPIHEQGNTIWKELKATQDIIFDGKIFKADLSDHQNGTAPTIFELTLNFGHIHMLELSPEQMKDLNDGKTVTETSSERNGHTHQVTLKKENGQYKILTMAPFENHGLALASG